MVVLSVPVKVIELLAVNVFPSAMVKVEPVAGAVKVTLLIVVADATPKVGVVKVGLVAKTIEPEPVVVLPKAVTVPLVGSVKDVVAVVVSVVAKAPEVVKLPPRDNEPEPKVKEEPEPVVVNNDPVVPDAT